MRSNGRRAPALALLLAFGTLSLACGTTGGGSGASLTPTPTGVTEFHASVFNACTVDVTLLVGVDQASGRKVLLFKQSRDTVTGTGEAIWLLDEREQPIAMIQPVQGNQRLQVTSDCTGIVRAP
ncbi:MAG TPA: hypothetical protein PKW35_01250 [Nannocystaceae bacterium]|nr:hypothetical protein [Nannocystaceae bacterium]